MVRIAGVELPNKRIEIAFTYVYGIGRSRARKILKEVGIDFNVRAKELTEEQAGLLRQFLEKHKESILVEGDLRQKKVLALRRLSQIGCYRGIRHNRKLPVQGQRTKTNARTRKGKGKTIANKKQVGK